MRDYTRIALRSNGQFVYYTVGVHFFTLPYSINEIFNIYTVNSSRNFGVSISWNITLLSFLESWDSMNSKSLTWYSVLQKCSTYEPISFFHIFCSTAWCRSQLLRCENYETVSIFIITCCFPKWQSWEYRRTKKASYLSKRSLQNLQDLYNSLFLSV